MAIRNKKKGIFCIEGLWDYNNIQDKSTVLPILELLQKGGYCDFIYHDSATRPELEFYLDRWKNKAVNEKYPILYLAFHGDMGCIYLTKNETYSLDDLSTFLEDKCHGKVIYFGSCSTLNLHGKVVKNFLEKIGAIAAIGYKNEVDWIQSAACDLFVLEALQHDKLDNMGIDKIHKSIISEYGNLHRKLELTFIINDRQHFPRRRK